MNRLGRLAVRSVPRTHARAQGRLASTVPVLYGSMEGLLPAPKHPQGKICIVETRGGSDKGSDGHRRDTIPIANGIIQAGFLAEPVYYSDPIADDFAAYLKTCDGMVLRVNPGYPYKNFTFAKYVDVISKAALDGTLAMAHPDVVKKMGAKDALCKISHLECGLIDTFAYYTKDELAAGFKKTAAFQPRVIKQNRGSQGEGVWIVELVGKEYCKNFGDAELSDSDMLKLTEMNDNHVEHHTVGEFIEFCTNGRTAKSGEWTSQGVGKYLEGGSDGQLVDQRFLPRIVEGEIRCLMVGDKLIEIVHKVPQEGAISATLQSGAKYTVYAADAPEFKNLVKSLNKDLPVCMSALGLEGVPFPLIWTIDFILGPKDEAGNDTYVIGEFNCTCVGITQQLDRAPLVGLAAVNNVKKYGK